MFLHYITAYSISWKQPTMFIRNEQAVKTRLPPTRDPASFNRGRLKNTEYNRVEPMLLLHHVSRMVIRERLHRWHLLLTPEHSTGRI